MLVLSAEKVLMRDI